MKIKPSNSTIILCHSKCGVQENMDRFSHIWRICFCILYQEICILTVKMPSVVKICNQFWLPDAQMLVFRYNLGQTWEPHPKKVNVCNTKVGKYRGSS